MAYFACAKAALTGTDARTRASIAKGLVSPYFTNSSGNQIPRGVVQLDMISGNDLSYLQGVDRPGGYAADIQARQNPNYLSGGRTARSTRQYTESQQVSNAALHQGSTGTIQTTNTAGIPIKTLGIIGAIGIVVILVLKK